MFQRHGTQHDMETNHLKYGLSFYVDVSDLGCGCNGALYLVAIPAAGATLCGDYYCDANYVCGEGCVEMDTLEANKEAVRVTAHTRTAMVAAAGLPLENNLALAR